MQGKDALELSDFLEELHWHRCAPGVYPPNVSQWNSTSADTLVRKHFKVVRRLVSSEDFAVRYFWAGQNVLFQKWHAAQDVQGLLKLAEEATAKIDMNENELFLPRDVVPYINRQYYSQEISAAAELLQCVDLQVKNMSVSMSAELNIRQERNIESYRYTENALQMRTGLLRWMKFLSRVVEHSPATINEQTYQRVFEKYLESFHINYVNGDLEQLGIPYRYGQQVSCVPNILLVTEDKSSRSSRYSGVVEVKRMTLDPSFKHAFDKTPKQGILRDNFEGATPPKKRKVNFSAADDETSQDVKCELAESSEKTENSEKTVQFEHKEESHSYDFEDDDSVSASTSKMEGSKVPECVQNLIKTFFGQLFGSVLALDIRQPADQAKQRLGIGVVGFRVIFFAFYARHVNFSKIPQQQNSRMKVYMTCPLCLLVARDRAEIAKLLLQVAVKKPLKSLP